MNSDQVNSGQVLPAGWVWTTLAECAEVITGRTPSKSKSQNYGDHLPFVKPPELKNGIIDRAEDNLSIEGAREARVLPPKSVLVSCIGNLGKTGINRIPVAFNQQINAVIFPDSIVPEYGFYYFQSTAFRDWLDSVSSATTVTIVNKGKFQQARFPLAPPAEQRRIVAKIEELFTRLDAGVAALKRVQAALKRYKASVLKAACEGRLVPQDSADEPAEQLLARILAERRAKWEAEQSVRAHGRAPRRNYEEPQPPDTAGLPDLPAGWCWATVEQVGSVQLGRQRTPKHHQGKHMRPYLRVANVFEDRIDTSDVMEMNFTPEEYPIYKLEYGDILLNEGQSPELLGRPAMYRDEVPGACFQNTLIRFKASPVANPQYALFVFRAHMHSGRFAKEATITTNIAHLSGGRFARVEFPLPPLPEQRRIVAEVERRLSVAAEVEKTVADNLARAGRLRQAILHRAFTGRLVPQEAKDEPAEKLLERIRAGEAPVQGELFPPAPRRSRRQPAA